MKDWKKKMRHEKSENIQVNAFVSRSHKITYVYIRILDISIPC